MLLRVLKLLYLSLITAATLTCGRGGKSSDSSSEPPKVGTDPVPIPTNLNCSGGTKLTYESFGEAVMLSHCTSCHSSSLAGDARAGAPTEINLDTPADMSLWRSLILETAVVKNTMPPVYTLSEAERKQLEEWLNCGAPGGTVDAITNK